MSEPEPLKFAEFAKPAGAYWIGGVHVGLGVQMPKRPHWLHRLAMRWVFGWEWRDADPLR
ncbi:MAG TPA: hypothetical protein VFB63_19500 [Bryobacteraceae bacterium]|nr:hypothetical protein [Bryobacteraceae bacterium]